MTIIEASESGVQSLVHLATAALEFAGTASIFFGAVLAALLFVKHLFARGYEFAYHSFKTAFGRTILLGLEFLVGADILKSLVTPHELQDLLGLALLMVARTFLSVSLSVEINGHWPWQETRLSRERSAGGAT
jgi:uncharacterized membrane protein